MRRFPLFFLLILVAACQRDTNRAPVVVGALRTGDSAILSGLIARRLEMAGCRADRRFTYADAAAIDRALGAGEVDVYVESHRAAVRAVLRVEPREAADNETRVRTAWIKRDLVWAPSIGLGDYAAVFRKDIDEKCRAASRTLMATAYSVDEKAMAGLRRTK